MKRVFIPISKVRIEREKERPTKFIMHKKTGLLRGRLEKGDKENPNFRYGKFGETRTIRMIGNHKGFEKGQIVARTKQEYPNQKNSTLIRKNGKLSGITITKEYNRNQNGNSVHVKGYKKRR